MAWITIGTFAASLIGLAFQLVTMVLKRRWDREDKSDKAALAAFTEAQATKTRAALEEKHAELRSDIQANTEVNVAALDAGNGFQEKYMALQQQIRELVLTRVRPRRVTDVLPTQQLDTIEQNTETIKQAVIPKD